MSDYLHTYRGTRRPVLLFQSKRGSLRDDDGSLEFADMKARIEQEGVVMIKEPVSKL